MRLKNIFKTKKQSEINFSHKPKKLISLRNIFFSFLLISISLTSFFISKKIVGIFSFMTETKNSFLDQVSINTNLRLKEIHVTGRNYISTDLLLQTIGLKSGTPILTIDIVEIEKKLNDLGWTKNVVVERRMPDTLLIKIEEHEPIALLQKKDEHILISLEGRSITQDTGEFNHLPVIMGEDAEKYAYAMLNALSSEPNLFHQVWAISFISKRRWDVHLRSGVIIKLPENYAIEAWAKLAEINRIKSIISRDIKAIDLRSPDSFIIIPENQRERST